MQDACAKIELRFISMSPSQDIRAPIVKDGCDLTAKGTEILSLIVNILEKPFVLAARSSFTRSASCEASIGHSRSIISRLQNVGFS